MKDWIPYTYCITFIPNGMQYYGVRYAKGCHPDDLWVTYFTSSNTIKRLIKSHGIGSFSTEIRRTFPQNPKLAISWEERVLQKIFSRKSMNLGFLNFMNRHNRRARSSEECSKAAKLQWDALTPEEKDAKLAALHSNTIKAIETNKRNGTGMYHDKSIQSAAGKKAQEVLNSVGYFQSDKWRKASSRANTTWITNGTENKRFNNDELDKFLNENPNWKRGTTKNVVMPNMKGSVFLYEPYGEYRIRVIPGTQKYYALISEGYWSKNGKHGKIPESMKNHKNPLYTDQMGKAWKTRKSEN